MNVPSLSALWLQVLAVLAIEIGLITLVVALLWRCVGATAWRRAFCQVGIIATIVVTVVELSGSARFLGGCRSPGATRANGADLRIEAPLPPTAPSGLNPAVLPANPWPQRATVVQLMPVVPASAGNGNPRLAQVRRPSTVRLADDGVEARRLLWLGLIWGTGSLLAGARVCLMQCLFLVYRWRRQPVTDAPLVRRTEALARALGMSHRVRIIESAQLASPIAYGWLRPTIGLPPDFGKRFDAASQEAILIHELAHLAAHDPFWCLVADAASVVLWWHPGVWWLRLRLRLASEMVADEASMLVADGPRVLAECLVELGARLTQPRASGFLPVSGFRSQLGRRVQQLVGLEGRQWSPPRPGRAALIRIFGPMALAAVVVLCTAWAAPQAIMKGDRMNATNWKRTLAAFTVLAAVGNPETALPAAKSETLSAGDTPAAQPAGSPTSTPPTKAPGPEVGDLPVLQGPTKPDPTAAETPEGRKDLVSLPSGTTRVATPAPANTEERPQRGSALEARLRQIHLDQIAIDGLPLGEVLRLLVAESIRHDPQKAGVNFLIVANRAPVPVSVRLESNGELAAGRAVETFDMSAVIVNFNLPLRNVTLKNVLDAIVTVADHAIEYRLEDYAVVFSAKSQAVGGIPAVAGPGGNAPMRVQRYAPTPPVETFTQNLEPVWHPTTTPEALSDTRPQRFNVSFGSPSPSPQAGPAAAGRAGDFWNAVSRGFNDHYVETGLKFAEDNPSPIAVEMINLGGAWGARGGTALKSPMLDQYNYPTCNHGGNSKVILHQVPPAKYNLYLYGYSSSPLYYGDYTVTVGKTNYGRKKTASGADAVRSTKWVEGSQYVKFPAIKVGLGEDVEVLIQPGGEVSDGTRTFADAMISGLQLIPAK